MEGACKREMHHGLRLTMSTASLMKRDYCEQQVRKYTTLYIILLFGVCVCVCSIGEHIRIFLLISRAQIFPKTTQAS